MTGQEDRRANPKLAVSLPSGDRVGLLEMLREDFEANGRGWANPGYHALVVHRCENALRTAPRRVRAVLSPLVKVGAAWVRGVYGIDLAGARVGRRLALPHAQGVVLNPYVTIGDDCMLRHNVTLGQASDTRTGVPSVGHRVQFGPGAVAVGEITIGDDVLVGPNAVVVKDVPPGHRVLAPLPAVRLPRGPST